jgi:hypothetical protein
VCEKDLQLVHLLEMQLACLKDLLTVLVLVRLKEIQLEPLLEIVMVKVKVHEFHLFLKVISLVCLLVLLLVHYLVPKSVRQ